MNAKIFERITYITPVVQDEEETVDTRCNETDLELKRLKETIFNNEEFDPGSG